MTLPPTDPGPPHPHLTASVRRMPFPQRKDGLWRRVSRRLTVPKGAKQRRRGLMSRDGCSRSDWYARACVLQMAERFADTFPLVETVSIRCPVRSPPSASGPDVEDRIRPIAGSHQ